MSGCTSAIAAARPRQGNRFIAREARCHPDRPRYGHGLCAECYRAEHRSERAAAERRRHLRQYALSEADYEFLFRQQDGLCAICREPETRVIRGVRTALIVDHCHVTSEIKGLLCYRCNLALGYFREAPRIVRTAVEYLSAFRERTA